MTSPHERALSYAGDAVSAGAIVATFMGYLPALAGLAGLVWYIIQIWESKTVQKHIRRLRARQRAARRASLIVALQQTVETQDETSLPSS